MNLRCNKSPYIKNSEIYAKFHMRRHESLSIAVVQVFGQLKEWLRSLIGLI
jgi:hypothetical protein